MRVGGPELAAARDSQRDPVLFQRFCSDLTWFRKILVSVKCLSVILGPEMGAPILWTPGKMRSFCRKTYVHKIPRFFWGGGWVFWVFGGGSQEMRANSLNRDMFKPFRSHNGLLR